MVIIVLENVPLSLRGLLTRWMIEPKTGVFVGKISAMVRDLIWEQICKNLKCGGGIMIHTTNNEQGYAILAHGNMSRLIEDFEGISLVKIP